MQRKDRLLLGVSLTALAGIGVLATTTVSYLWRQSVLAEEALVGGLATSLGARAEAMILETRGLLRAFDSLPQARCSPGHLRALQEAAIARPYLRAVGYWRAAERQCGVGFLQGHPLRPSRADRIYDSGVIAWWPSAQTEVGGVRLFLMRFGDHDVAIDPRVLLDIGPLAERQAGLWVEDLLLTAEPVDAQLPSPSTLPLGLTLDREAGRAISRVSVQGVLPIDIVAIEPLRSFWDRYAWTLIVGTVAGLVLVAAWAYTLMRYTRHRLSMGTQLRWALARGQLHVCYQPIVSLATRRCVGAEALSRWTLEGGEAVSPETFVPVAEREGLLSDLSRVALAAPLRDLGQTLRDRPELWISVNLGAADLTDERFAEALERGLAESGLASRSVKLEVTERALVNTESARAMIRRWRAQGHQIAVDDFGTGYSSLSYLETFELDVLKIDKSFVDAIGTEAATSYVIGHVIGMARSLGLKTVAEGVETEEQAAWLTSNGVDLAQGFHFSSPLSHEEFVRYIQADRTA